MDRDKKKHILLIAVAALALLLLLILLGIAIYYFVSREPVKDVCNVHLNFRSLNTFAANDWLLLISTPWCSTPDRVEVDDTFTSGMLITHLS